MAYRTPNIKEEPGRWDSVAKATRKKWLVELLANKHALGSLLEFLKNTEAGSREGAAGVEAKEGSGWGRPFRRLVAPVYGLSSGRQKYPKAEYGDSAKKEK